MGRPESKREQERRARVVRQEEFQDGSEELERRIETAVSDEEKAELQREYADRRRRHRQEEVEAGRRRPGISISMHQMMWAEWAEVAVERELEARGAFSGILAKRPKGPGGTLSNEFHASLGAVRK